VEFNQTKPFSPVYIYGRVSEIFEQLPHPNRADMLNQIQRHQSFTGFHRNWVPGEPPTIKQTFENDVEDEDHNLRSERLVWGN